MASILVVDGPNKGEYYPLEKRMVLVGRDEDCLIQIVDEEVSRMHLKIWYEPAGKSYRARDMKSANGTFIEGRQIDGEVPLVPGMKIRIGNTELVFSEMDFSTPEVAFEHYEQERQKGERGKETMIR